MKLNENYKFCLFIFVLGNNRFKLIKLKLRGPKWDVSKIEEEWCNLFFFCPLITNPILSSSCHVGGASGLVWFVLFGRKGCRCWQVYKAGQWGPMGLGLPCGLWPLGDMGTYLDINHVMLNEAKASFIERALSLSLSLSLSCLLLVKLPITLIFFFFVITRCMAQVRINSKTNFIVYQRMTWLKRDKVPCRLTQVNNLLFEILLGSVSKFYLKNIKI